MDDVIKVILKSNSKKIFSVWCHPCKYILKQGIEVHLKYLTNVINYSLKESTFLDELKQSEVIPVFKKPDLYRRRIIDQRVYYHTHQKSLKE